MRVIHLCFQVHAPLQLRDEILTEVEGRISPYYDSQSAFEKANTEIYQPLFALLERNVQKHSKFRFSLMLSGTWLDQVERYDFALLERLQKLVKTGQVELIVQPYYHSLAYFYDQDELAEQTRLYRTRIQELFGVEGRIFALPELVYADAIGHFAERLGFAGMLVGGSPEVLDWHSPNHVYEAIGCRYLRLLFRNTTLSEAIAGADPELMAEKTITEDDKKQTKVLLSAEKLQKRLELECLRGHLINLYFNAEVIKARRADGIVGMFDELIEQWLEVSGNHFAGAAQACMAETPSVALALRKTVSWRPSTEGEPAEKTASLVLSSDETAVVPDWLVPEDIANFTQRIYTLQREVAATADAELLSDFRPLTDIKYLDDLASYRERIEKIMADLHQRAERIKKTQAEELAQVYTKKHERNLDDDTTVKVNFQSKPKPVVNEVEFGVDVAEPNDEVGPDTDMSPADEPSEQSVEPAKKKRRIIRKLVIE